MRYEKIIKANSWKIKNCGRNAAENEMEHFFGTKNFFASKIYMAIIYAYLRYLFLVDPSGMSIELIELIVPQEKFKKWK